ncbi:hypothetical protein PS1_017353 [Malus domestica]
MRSARSTQQKESELRNSRSCHIYLKKQAEKNAACTINSAERALWAARADSPPLNRILKDQVTNWKKSSSILKIIPLTKLLRCELERLNKETGCHLYLVPACHVSESTFKNQASTALEEVSSQIQDQASTALEEITTLKYPGSRRIKKVFFVLRSSFFQDQASTALGSTIIHLQDQAPTALEESVLRSLFIVLPRSSPNGPLDQQSSTFKIKPRRPLKKAFFVLCSSFFQDQAPTALWINNHPPIQDQAPTALEESVLRSLFIVHHPFIQDQAQTALWINNVDKSTHPTVLQDQAQKPLKIRSSLFFEIKPKNPFEDPLKPTFKDQAHGPLKKLPTVHPRSSLDAPLGSTKHPQINTFKDQAHDPLKKLPTVHPRSSLDGPGINRTSTNQHLTEIESEDQNRERL